MNLNLTAEEIKLMKSIFSSYQEDEDRKKEITSDESELKKKAAQVLDSKPAEAAKVLSAMLKIYEDGENPLDDICNVVDVIQNGQGTVQSSSEEDSKKES